MKSKKPTKTSSSISAYRKRSLISSYFYFSYPLCCVFWCTENIPKDGRDKGEFILHLNTAWYILWMSCTCDIFHESTKFLIVQLVQISASDLLPDYKQITTMQPQTKVKRGPLGKGSWGASTGYVSSLWCGNYTSSCDFIHKQSCFFWHQHCSAA